MDTGSSKWKNNQYGKHFDVFGGNLVDVGQRTHLAVTIEKDLVIVQKVLSNYLLEFGTNPDGSKRVITAQLSGRMRRFHIRVLPGDRVRVAVSPYDPTHGLIVFRGK